VYFVVAKLRNNGKKPDFEVASVVIMKSLLGLDAVSSSSATLLRDVLFPS
jgi:hypothetical protein